MKKIQQMVKDFAKTHSTCAGQLEHKILILVHEAGDISKQALKMSDYGKNKISCPGAFDEKMSHELGEMLFSIADIANCLNIDLEKSFDDALKEMNEKGYKP